MRVRGVFGLNRRVVLRTVAASNHTAQKPGQIDSE